MNLNAAASRSIIQLYKNGRIQKNKNRIGNFTKNLNINKLQPPQPILQIEGSDSAVIRVEDVEDEAILPTLTQSDTPPLNPQELGNSSVLLGTLPGISTHSDLSVLSTQPILLTTIPSLPEVFMVVCPKASAQSACKPRKPVHQLCHRRQQPIINEFKKLYEANLTSSILQTLTEHHRPHSESDVAFFKSVVQGTPSPLHECSEITSNDIRENEVAKISKQHWVQNTKNSILQCGTTLSKAKLISTLTSEFTLKELNQHVFIDEKI
jgi:hypothetical protein